MYEKHFSTKKTSQGQPIPDSDQVANSAGGFSWAVDDWTRLERFLVLGAEGGTYYIGEQTLTIENAQSVLACIHEDGLRVVGKTLEVSAAGRAPKNNPALFVLAMCAGLGDDQTRKEALAVLPAIARIGTHLFVFLNYVQAFRGWGRGLRKAVGDWYNDKELDALAYQVVKYRQRYGWTHRDALRKAHPKAEGEHNALYHWITQNGDVPEVPLIQAFVKAQEAVSPVEIKRLIKEHDLPREAIPTQFLKEPMVWNALLAKMPIMAMVRNLGNMSKVGMLIPGKWDVIDVVVDRLRDKERLQKSRIHPLQILAALITYGQGHGQRGSGSWETVPQVLEALDDAFYLAFDNVEPTGKRWVLGLDVSGSMSTIVHGIPGLSCRIAAAVMAMVTARAEHKHAFVAFSHELVPFPVSANERLDDVVERMRQLSFGRTDCALPMLWAMDNDIEADVFVVYTDNETWFGDIHPAQALTAYRNKMNISAKLAVVGMASNGFTIADPQDLGMLDFVGLDTATPAVLAAFASEG